MFELVIGLAKVFQLVFQNADTCLYFIFEKYILTFVVSFYAYYLCFK